MSETSLLLRSYARKLLELEVTSFSFDRGYPPDHEPLLNYVRSTNNRRSFCMLCIVAAMDGTHTTPSRLVTQLGVSRNAVDAMIQECEGNHWIIVDRDERDYRTIYATDFVTQVYIDYAEWVADRASELGFADIQGALNLLRGATK